MFFIRYIFVGVVKALFSQLITTIVNSIQYGSKILTKSKRCYQL